MKHSSPNQRSFILHLFIYVVSESLIFRRGCGYVLFVFFLFPFLSFCALYFKLISWKCVRMLSSGMPAVIFQSGREPRVYLRDAILSLIHCNKCHCKAGEGELAFINIRQFWSPSGGR